MMKYVVEIGYETYELYLIEDITSLLEISGRAKRLKYSGYASDSVSTGGYSEYLVHRDPKPICSAVKIAEVSDEISEPE